ncbi:small acid-soluble spore protein P [Gorillibacterium massiliense]|nr:small acid-soluble spore protein P [Gorillibacterium massiliense]
MPVDNPQPVNQPGENRSRNEGRGPQEPLSGSKKVKNRNHSRSNKGEGR